MYIDNQTKLIFDGLPEVYNERKISNFNSLTDSELEQLDIFKCSGFVEDEDFNLYSFLLGTEYYNGAYFTFDKQDDKIKVYADTIGIKLYLTDVLQRNYRNYATIQDMVFNFPKPKQKQETSKEELFAYDWENSYMFILFGTSSLVHRPDKNGAYSLKRTHPNTIPNIQVDDVVQQSTGFSAKVSLVIAEKNIVKIVDCKNVDKLDRSLPIQIGTNVVNSTDIFSYEMYLLTYGVNKNPLPNDYSRHLSGQQSKELLVRNLYTTPDITYFENYMHRLTDENKTLYHVDTGADVSSEPSSTRKYIITNYGRQE